MTSMKGGWGSGVGFVMIIKRDNFGMISNVTNVSPYTLVNVYVALPVFTPVAVVHTPILWNKMAAPMI